MPSGIVVSPAACTNHATATRRSRKTGLRAAALKLSPPPLMADRDRYCVFSGIRMVDDLEVGRWFGPCFRKQPDPPPQSAFEQQTTQPGDALI